MKVLLKEFRPYGYAGLWCNKYGSCLENGNIVNFIRQIQSDKTIAIPYGDGLIEGQNGGNSEDYKGYADEIILGVHCYRNPISIIKNKLVCIPLDDRLFELGVKTCLEQDSPNIYISWNEKIPKAFWRGAGPHPALRDRVLKELFGFEHSDCFYTKTPWSDPKHYDDPENKKYWLDIYTGDPQPIHISEFIKHKYILIMDCFIISSSFQWVFGSGSVPILISHPDTEFWFKKYLIPFVNYVPVNYSLDNLRETIQYLVDNDDKAQEIAKGARDFSDKIFSPDFQKQYLVENLQ